MKGNLLWMDNSKKFVSDTQRFYWKESKSIYALDEFWSRSLYHQLSDWNCYFLPADDFINTNNFHMRTLLINCLLIFFTIPLFSQHPDKPASRALTPFVGVLAGGCVYNPFSFIAGVQRPITNNFSISYDVHFWNTRYKDQYDGVLSKGKWTSVTPSVKITYSTGKKEGTGLGMLMVYSTINKVNGKIDVDSEKGKGTTFLISIPA